MKINAEVARAVKTSYSLTIAYYLLEDLYSGLRLATGGITTTSGATHISLSVEESVKYITEVFEDYKRYSGIPRFYGRVAEIGPGDNCGVALLFLLDGCQCVDLVDRFYSIRSIQKQTAICQALVDHYPGMASLVGRGPFLDEGSFPNVRRHYGTEAAAERFFVGNRGYDFILSRAVLEHLYDPIGALNAMTSALNPGGYLMHKVDLKDHGMFSVAHDSCKFLEVPGWLYPWLTRNSGRPNRVLAHKYREFLRDSGLEGRILVTSLVGVGDIEPHVPFEAIPERMRDEALKRVGRARSRFARVFDDVPDQDLAVDGIFLIARRGDR